MNWIYLLTASIFEVGFTFCMAKAKESVAPDTYYWYAGFAVCLIIGMFLLVKATQAIPVGTAYAIFTGIGAVGTVLIGMLVFKEPANAMRLFFMATLIASVIGLKMVSH